MADGDAADPGTRWRGLLVIGVLVAVVLAPMWYVGLQGEATSEEIEIEQSVSDIRPLGGPIEVPTKLSLSQVGVIVWIALFALYGALVGVHRFVNSVVRPPEGEADAVVSDGGCRPDAGRDTASGEKRADGGVGPPSWLRSEDRAIVEYHDATGSNEGKPVAADESAAESVDGASDAPTEASSLRGGGSDE